MIGLIGAMDVEVSLLCEKLEQKEVIQIFNYKFYKGKFGKNDVVILRSGVGKVQSAIGAALMVEHFKPNFILNTGVAGGTNGLKQYDVLIAETLRYSDVDATGFGYKLGQVPGMPEFYATNSEYRNKITKKMDELNFKYYLGNILSGDSFILSTSQLMLEPQGLTAVEMEGASIAQACYLTNTPFVSIRFISDVVGGSNQSDEYSKFEEVASKESANISYEIIKSIKID